MWWKLGGLLVLTAALIIVIIPIRSDVVIYDPAKVPPPPPPTLWEMVGKMYLTPGTLVLIAIILGIAGFVAFKVARGHW